MSAPRIAVVTTVHVPGDTRIWHKQVGSLAGAGWDVHYLAPDLDGFEGREGVVLHGLGPRRLGLRARLGRLRRALREVRRLDPDVIHFHDPELLPAFAWFGPRRARLIYDIHENVRRQLLIKPWLPLPLRGVVAGVYGLLERLSLRRVALVVLAEDSYAPLYRDRRAVVVKNYPVLERLAPGPRDLGPEPRVCYVGGLSVERGAVDLLRAFRGVLDARPDARLVVAGPAHAPLSTDGLREMAEGLGIGDRTEVRGRVPLPEAYDLMAGSAVGVAPLRAAGNYVASLPTKMFEYMSCALPVVVSDFPLWRSIVEKRGCGRTFAPGEPEALAAAILDVLADPDRYAAMSAAGLAAVFERYGWDAEAAKLLQAYRELPGVVAP
jgi:glycosyltransferase involved in cell wall biosynthesis